MSARDGMRESALYLGWGAVGLVLAALSASCGAGPKPARALVSCDRQLTQMLVELGAAPALVGVDALSRRMPGLEAALDLGPGCEDAPRTLPGLGPDQVLILGTEQGSALAASLAQRGQAAVVFEPRTLDEVLDAYQRLGVLLGDDSSAQLAVARLTRAISGIAVRRDGRARLTVAWLLGRDPLTAVGGDGLLHEILELAGAENAFHGSAAQRIELTAQELADRAPDLLFDSTGAPARLSGLASIPVDPALAALPALDPLPRIRALHALLYPEEPVR